MIYDQMLMPGLESEIAVDLFAGGGGASCGYEMATGRVVDIAVNHDPAAVAMHALNHPQTHHDISDVFEVDPRQVTRGRPVGLLWASPDCTYHSKARGGRPIRDANRKRRALAWVVTRWAGQVRPRVICLENVEEFANWGPLAGPPDGLRPHPRRRGRTFRAWVRSLRRLGYAVEWRELRACDYGAPTIRKRLFVIARCDGRPIAWPEPTHGPGRPQPYRTAAECIDWATPMLSIFATPEEARAWAKATDQGTPIRPLADATMRRIARGVVRYVLESPAPFIVGVGGRQGQSPARSLEQPYQTITAKGDAALVAPYMVPRYGERAGQQPRSRSLEQPAPVIVPTGNGGSLVGAFLAKHYGGHESPGAAADAPFDTVTTIDHHALVAASLSKLRGTSSAADPAEPLHTISAGGNHHTAVAAFLQTYYGQGIGQSPGEPMRTIPTLDRFGLVTVTVQGRPYTIVDIAMRMLQPRELYRAQGFPDSYVIDRGARGRKLTKTEQVRMVGNSVAPPIAAALIRANLPDMIARDAARQQPKRRRRPEAIAAD